MNDFSLRRSGSTRAHRLRFASVTDSVTHTRVRLVMKFARREVRRSVSECFEDPKSRIARAPLAAPFGISRGEFADIFNLANDA